MTEENPFEHHTDAALIKESGMGHPGYAIEATRRLVVATEKQSRAAGRLTWAIIFLMVVQILVAGTQVAVALVAIGRMGR